MKSYMKRLFTVVFAVLAIAMFSGCTSVSPAGGCYQEEPCGEVKGGSGSN